MKRHIQIDLELLGMRVPHAVLIIYGLLRLHAWKNGECWPTQETLAEESGLSRRHVIRVLAELQRLRLIECRWGPASNRYRLLDPDPAWIKSQIGQKRPISDVPNCHFKSDKMSPPADVTGCHSRCDMDVTQNRFKNRKDPPTPQPPPPEGGRGATPRPVETAASDDGEQQQQAALREDAFAVAAFLDVDLQTAAAFLGRCRAADPGCTLADIQAEITQIAKSLSANRRNPTGIYLTQVPARLATKAETAKRKGEKQAAAPNGHDFAAEAEELRRQWVGMDESERNWWRRERPELIPDEWKTG